MMDDPVLCARLVAVARLFDDPPAFGLPIFLELGTEDGPHLIQDVAADGAILAFVPIDITDVSLQNVDDSLVREVGGAAFLAFEGPNASLQIAERDQLRSTLGRLLSDGSLADRPFMRASIAEFCHEAEAVRAAELDAAEWLAAAPQTANYYRINVLARNRINQELEADGQDAIPPAFRLLETEDGVHVELPRSADAGDLERVQDAIDRCKADLATLSDKAQSSWKARSRPSDTGRNEETLSSLGLWPPSVPEDSIETEFRSLQRELGLVLPGDPVRRRAWLNGREDQPGWIHAWQTLVGRGFEVEELLPLGRAWLHGREDQPGWFHVWRTLVGRGFDVGELLPLGRAWLHGREDQPDWFPVWRTLVDQGFEVGELLPLARAWLEGHEDRPQWFHVWRTFVDQGFEVGELLPLARAWLHGREDQGDWSHVWRTLVGQGFEVGELLPLGGAWLHGREDQGDWSYVWRTLVDQGFEVAELLPLGRAWLHGREDQGDWSHVWRTLVGQGFEVGELLPLGGAWLHGRGDQGDWSYVWERLVAQRFEIEELLPLGRSWLRGREDQPDWPHVWRKLVDQGFQVEQLLPLGRTWLDGHEAHPEYRSVHRIILGARPK